MELQHTELLLHSKTICLSVESFVASGLPCVEHCKCVVTLIMTGRAPAGFPSHVKQIVITNLFVSINQASNQPSNQLQISFKFYNLFKPSDLQKKE